MAHRTALNRSLVIALLFLLLALPTLTDTTVTSIDVGQGDSIWIHDDAGHDVLIDAGDVDQGPVVLGYLQDIPDLDVVLWTHAHSHHVGGLIDVVAERPVGQVLYNGFDYDSATFNDLWELIAGYAIPPSPPAPGTPTPGASAPPPSCTPTTSTST